MKFTLSQVEIARRNPNKFAASRGAGFPVPLNFRMFFNSALNRFHAKKFSVEQTLAFFNVECERISHQHNYAGRLNRYRETLRIYCETCAAQGLDFIHWSLRVNTRIGPHILTGTVRNLHLRVSPSGYTVIHTQLESSDWTKELKWPLVQHTVAGAMGASSEEVDIRAFRMDTGDFERHVYSVAEVETALADSRELFDEIEDLWPIAE